MPKFEVGDILWVVSTENPGLHAVRIVEEVTKKTLSGKKTSYCVVSTLGIKSKQPRKYDLEDIDGKIFTSAKSAKTFMVSSAEEAINKMISVHDRLINKYWTTKEKQPKLKAENDSQIKLNSAKEETVITLENGTVARIKIPEQFKEVL
jgi:formamidopyrimidine-DNA glycosylase